MLFFETLRTAVGRYAAGVHILSAPTAEPAINAAERRLKKALPTTHREFLRSFDGVSLFHEAHILFAAAEIVRVGPELAWLRVGETPDGMLWLDDHGRLFLLDEAAPDPICMASSTEAWLNATLAREGLLVDREGEFRDVFEDDAISPPVRRKRAALGLRHDPQAALYLLEQAELCLEDGAIENGIAALQAAVARDPQAGPAWELLATVYADTDQIEAAQSAALRAAQSSWHAPLQSARSVMATRLRTRDSLRVL